MHFSEVLKRNLYPESAQLIPENFLRLPREGGKGHWSVIYTGTQRLPSYSFAQKFWNFRFFSFLQTYSVQTFNNDFNL